MNKTFLIIFIGVRSSEQKENSKIFSVRKKVYYSCDCAVSARKWAENHINNYLNVSTPWLDRAIDVDDYAGIPVVYGLTGELERDVGIDLSENLNPVIQSFCKNFMSDKVDMMRHMLRIDSSDVSEKSLARQAKFILDVFLSDHSKSLTRFQKSYGYEVIETHCREMISDSLEFILGIGDHAPFVNEVGNTT